MDLACMAVSCRQLGYRSAVEWNQRLVRYLIQKVGVNRKISVNNRRFRKRITDIDLEPIQECLLLIGSKAGIVSLVDLRDIGDFTSNEPVLLNPRSSKSMKAKSLAAVSCVNWYPFDGGLFCSSSLEGELAIWDSNLFLVATLFSNQSPISSCRFHPANSTIALSTCDSEVSSSGSVSLYDVRMHSIALEINKKGSCLCLDWHPFNEYLIASGWRDGSVELVDVRMNRMQFLSGCDICHDRPISSVKFVSAYLASFSRPQVAPSNVFHSCTNIWNYSSSSTTSSSSKHVANLGLCFHEDSDDTMRDNYLQHHVTELIQLKSFKTAVIDDSIIIQPFNKGRSGELAIYDLSLAKRDLTGRRFLDAMFVSNEDYHSEDLTSMVYRKSACQLLTVGMEGNVAIWESNHDCSVSLGHLGEDHWDDVVEVDAGTDRPPPRQVAAPTFTSASVNYAAVLNGGF